LLNDAAGGSFVVDGYREMKILQIIAELKRTLQGNASILTL